jgi:glucose-1-phosphate cytidylyltransferase
MKVVILAGGYGTRISEETSVRPKPMVEIGDRPILWHIMKMYAHHGLRDFVICCGYKGYFIKEYFANYFLHHSDMTFDLQNNEMKVLEKDVEPWKVTLIDTGNGTMTGGRLKRVEEYIGDETFCLTYGDGVTDLNIANVIDFHKKQDSLATLTAVQPPGRFGTFRLGYEETKITSFREKPRGDNAWINGGFFVAEPEVISYIEGDETVWEREPLETLASEGKLSAYKYSGFWHPMDTLHDKNVLDGMWQSGDKPWKVWE